MRWALFVCLIALLIPFADAEAQQQGVIAGTVTDASGAPIAGAQVVVEGTDIGTLAGEQGQYRIAGVPVGEATVRVTLIGYADAAQTVTVVAGQTAVANFQLTVEAIRLDEIVATGYGTQRKINLTGAVGAVNAEQIESLPVPNVSQALQGLSPGLQVVDEGGQPGENGADILIRGRGTLGSTGRSRPLVLIDGVEGDMNDLNIKDVESVSVLKDASSAAIYGSRAANGVILITTKRAAAQEALNVTYDGYYGMQDITNFPEHVSIEDHMRLTNIAYVNAGRDPKYSEEYIQRTLAGDDPLNYPNTDWKDVMFNAAPIQDHSLRVTGGNEAARFALSLNFMEEDGIMPTTGSNRYGGRLNTDFAPTDRLSGGLDLAFNRFWWLNPGNDWATTFYIIHDTPPTMLAQYPDGTYGWSDTRRNPLAYGEASGQRKRTTTTGTVTGRANYDIFPDWVELQTVASVTFDHYNNEHFEAQQDFRPNGGPYWGPATLWRDMNDGQQVTLRALLDYGHTFLDAHDISGVVGYEQIKQDNEWFGANRREFYNNQLQQLDLGNGEFDSNWGGENEWALRSVFGRFTYSFMGRYLFEANARYDGSSRFAEGNRYGFFPSFSAAWRISEEPFFDVGWIDELKLRGSWGQLGNQDVGLYTYYSTIDLDNPYFFGNQLHTGAAKEDLTNEDISWETTTVTDVGFDASFLQSRLTLSGDVYVRRTEDILLDLPIPDIVGLGAPTQNAGIVENRGWEVAVGWQDRAGEVNYAIDFNLSDNRNEVIDLVGTGPYVGWDDATLEGHPIDAWYMFEAVGLFQSQEEIDNWADQPGDRWNPGDVKFKDQNGDGIINEMDKVVVGDPAPHYLFGINVNASWRNWDFGAFLQGVGERDQRIELGLAEGPMWENYTTTWHLDYWTPENPDARVPQPYIHQNQSTHYPSTWWMQDASYAKLRNVQLGYTLPAAVTDRMGLDRLRVYVTGKNLWQTSGMEIGLDPEVQPVRGDYYPQTESISIGTNISF